MPKNNLDDLMANALERWTSIELPTIGQTIPNGTQGSLPMAIDGSTIESELRALRKLVEQPSQTSTSQRSGDVSAIAELQASTRVPTPTPVKVSSSTSSQSAGSSDGGDTGKAILTAAGMVTGLGPLIA